MTDDIISLCEQVYQCVDNVAHAAADCPVLAAVAGGVAAAGRFSRAVSGAENRLIVSFFFVYGKYFVILQRRFGCCVTLLRGHGSAD